MKMYVKLLDDPTSKEKEKLLKILWDYNKKGKNDTKACKDIYPTAEEAPHFYATLKVYTKRGPSWAHSIGDQFHHLWLGQVLGEPADPPSW